MKATEAYQSSILYVNTKNAIPVFSGVAFCISFTIYYNNSSEVAICCFTISRKSDAAGLRSDFFHATAHSME